MTSATARPALLAALAALALGGHWPQWRGPAGDGVSPETDLPLTWGEQVSVAWKCPLPGEGASTPAVWGDAVFVTSQDGEKLLLLKVEKPSGRIAWTRTVGTGIPARGLELPKQGGQRRQQKFHELHNMASPSPVTDGERVIAHFGNGDLAAYNFDGRKLWQRNLQKDYGPYTIWCGHANSPVLYDDLVISVCMQDSLAELGGERSLSYVVAHDKRTGAERWKTPRMTGAKAEECDAYTTPILCRAGGRSELVVMGGTQMDAYDPSTG
jgi:outer membrane protein assembly factor BamB